MRTKLKGIVSAIIAVLACSIGLVSCGTDDELSDELKSEIETAYSEYWHALHEGYEADISVCQYGGTYSENIVVMVQADCEELPLEVYGETESGGTTYSYYLYVGEVLISYMGNSSFAVIVYTADKQIIELEDAYEDGIITAENLISIRDVFNQVSVAE